MKIAGAIAVVGATAAVMYTAQNAMPAGTFLAKDMNRMEKMYAKYVAQHGKNYLSKEEYHTRLQNFAQTHHAIHAHNKQNKSWTLEHNHMSDWTSAEKNSMNGFVPRVRGSTGVKYETVDMPQTVDWRDSLKSMKVIKNQGQCGSCWAFSTIGSIEADTEIKHGEYTSLSEQQLVDCSSWNNGCGGGNFDFAFDYEKTNGAEGETDYPYTAADGTCAYKKEAVKNHKVTGYNDVSSYDGQQLKASIAKGPTSIAIQANQVAFQSYSSGVIANDGSCGEQLDHAVLAIGYGTEGGKDYVLVRNSWGATWGDHGCVKLEVSDYSCACGCVDQPSHVHTQ
jgi:cathepsin L